MTNTPVDIAFFCPGCHQRVVPDILTDVFGSCCLNEKCPVTAVNKHWYLNGKLHREDGPAIERANGAKEWYLNGLLHRVNGPAIELDNGSNYWYLSGRRHRVNGPAVELSNGEKQWYLNGKLQRVI